MQKEVRGSSNLPTHHHPLTPVSTARRLPPRHDETTFLPQCAIEFQSTPVHRTHSLRATRTRHKWRLDLFPSQATAHGQNGFCKQPTRRQKEVSATMLTLAKRRSEPRSPRSLRLGVCQHFLFKTYQRSHICPPSTQGRRGGLFSHRIIAVCVAEPSLRSLPSPDHAETSKPPTTIPPRLLLPPLLPLQPTCLPPASRTSIRHGPAIKTVHDAHPADRGGLAYQAPRGKHRPSARPSRHSPSASPQGERHE